MKKIGFSILLFLVSPNLFGHDTVRTDLSQQWKKQHGERLVHFNLMPGAVGILEIKQAKKFSVFLNNKLTVKEVRRFRCDVDSLMGTYVFPLQVSVFAKEGTEGLMAHRISIAPEKNNKTGDRTFSNAVIVSSFILLISLVAMIRTSPHETLQYFNVIKALSIRNLDEGIVNMRVTSANNIFIYLFCSALVAINIFLYAGNMSLTVQRGSTANHLLNLLLIAGVVFLILTLKIIIISVLTRLFKITAFGPGQFYNYVRLMLFGFSISAAVLLTNFMIGVEIDKMISILTYFIIGLAVLFLAITFLKLYSRGGFTVFHLFSYLCASEIIPLVILLSLFFS